MLRMRSLCCTELLVGSRSTVNVNYAKPRIGLLFPIPAAAFHERALVRGELYIFIFQQSTRDTRRRVTALDYDPVNVLVINRCSLVQTQTVRRGS